ncbi:response regulator transcription factor, partial [Nocardioides stalactiti]|uniref:response regulator transcription factor n=1 Tax=Nocardioides stalactiti TaxID=2755356 RepID=UPI0016009CE9
ALAAQAYRAAGDASLAEIEQRAAAELARRLGMAATGTPAAPPPSAESSLSPRELEVLRRVAAGSTNREIADELVLSPRTVDRHVSNILTKLDVSTRAAAAAYAVENRLA